MFFAGFLSLTDITHDGCRTQVVGFTVLDQLSRVILAALLIAQVTNRRLTKTKQMCMNGFVLYRLGKSSQLADDLVIDRQVWGL